MPSHMPSSFASAAAGQASSRDTRNGRSDGQGRGSGDWYVSFPRIAFMASLEFGQTNIVIVPSSCIFSARKLPLIPLFWIWILEHASSFSSTYSCPCARFPHDELDV